MDNANFKARDYAASLFHRIRINNTIDAMDKMEGGHDIRKYSASARKELSSAGDIDVMTKDGKQIISVVPKLALVVAFSKIRDILQGEPDAAFIRIPDKLLLDSVLAILQ
jgi:hypothetical protein